MYIYIYIYLYIYILYIINIKLLFHNLKFHIFLHDPQVKYDLQFSTSVLQQFETVNNILLID